jgi:uncharacterized SAM-binding protein YcdF (DUF218 family)
MPAMTRHISGIALWRSLRRALIMLALIALIAIATGAAIVVQASRSDPPLADAAIVLLGDDADLSARLDRARQLYADGRVSRIVLAGSDTGPARASLASRGVIDELVVELQDADQIAQLAAASELLEQQQLRSALLIAEPVQTLRLLKIARDADLPLRSLPTGTQPDLSIGDIAAEVGRYFRYVLLEQ